MIRINSPERARAIFFRLSNKERERILRMGFIHE